MELKKSCVKHVQNQESRKSAHIFFFFFFGIYENKESSIILAVKKSVIHGLFGKAGFTKS